MSYTNCGFFNKADPEFDLTATFGTGHPIFISIIFIGYNWHNFLAALAIVSGLEPNIWTPIGIFNVSIPFNISKVFLLSLIIASVLNNSVNANPADISSIIFIYEGLEIPAIGAITTWFSIFISPILKAIIVSPFLNIAYYIIKYYYKQVRFLN